MAMFLKKTFTVSKVSEDDRMLPVEGAPRRKKTQFFKFPPWKNTMQLAESGCPSPTKLVKEILNEDDVFYPDGIVGPNAMFTDDPKRPLQAILSNRNFEKDSESSSSDSEDESEAENESFVLDEAEENDGAESDTEDSDVDCSSDEDLSTSPLTPSPLKNLPTRHPLSSSSSSDEVMAVAKRSVTSGARKSVKKCRKLSSSDDESDAEGMFKFLRPPIKEAKRVRTPSPSSSPLKLKGSSNGSKVEHENYENRAMLETPPIKSNDESYPWPWL